jgi:hypothetical protein
MTILFQDLRYGIRMLLNKPGFSAVALITLALGIGANTMIFSVVNGVLLNPLPFPDSGRLVRLGESHGKYNGNLTYASFLDLGNETESLENIAAARFWSDKSLGCRRARANFNHAGFSKFLRGAGSATAARTHVSI